MYSIDTALYYRLTQRCTAADAAQHLMARLLLLNWAIE